MKPILVLKNGKPFHLYEDIDKARQAMKEIGGWNLWEIWDMSMIPATEVKI